MKIYDDVTDNKNRTKLHKLLKGYGLPIQYSVFECQLNKTQFDKLYKESQKFIQEENDSIVYYCLCENCQKRISAIYKTDPLSGLTIIV